MYGLPVFSLSRDFLLEGPIFEPRPFLQAEPVIVSLLIKSHPVNPFGKQHGAPEDSERHVGDLGNFKTDGQGNAKASVEDKHIKLIGEQSVLGVR